VTTETATFAAGCFWGIEAAFAKVKGVISTTVGYTGGKTVNPSYEEVCSGRTGHAEAVEVVYDPSQVSYAELVELFWTVHDPTQLNRQGPDIGTNYRSAIFYHTPEQKSIAEESKKKVQESRRFGSRAIATEIEPAREFYPAEEYHQKFFEKQWRTCHL
jgi:peptide-methionine (S)-S-oxide reductase